MGAGLWEEGGGWAGGGSGPRAPGSGSSLRACAPEALGPGPGPGPWCQDPLARPSGCPQLPSQPAAAPTPTPRGAPATWAPLPLLSSGPGLRSGPKGIPFLLTDHLPFAPGAPRPGSGAQDAGWPTALGLRVRGHPAPRSVSREQRRQQRGSLAQQDRRRPTPGGERPPEPPPALLARHQRTRPEKETLSGPQARRGAGQEWEQIGTPDTSPASPRAPGAPPAAPGRRHLGQSLARVCVSVWVCLCGCGCVWVCGSVCVSV